MKFALAILTFLALANLALADFSTSAISKKCMAALIDLLNDKELEKCLPIGPIVLQAVADGPNVSSKSLTYFEDFADMAEKVCPAPKCSDSLIKSKLNEAAGPCSAELQALGMTGDQVADLVVQGYGYTYEILCFKSSDGEYCIVETVDNLKQYPHKTPPPEVICTDCNKAMYGPLTKLVNLVADSPIGKKLSFDPEKILHEDDVKNLCGENFSNGTVPKGVESSDGSGDESSDTKNETSNGSSSSKGDVGSEGAENSGSSSSSSSSNSSKSSDNKNNVAGSAPILKSMRSEYFVFGAIAIFAALL